jgi:hypothetical protein
MIGLGVLFLTGDWWPGIMIVIGVSMVAGTLTTAVFAFSEPPVLAASRPEPHPAPPPPQPSNIARVETIPVKPAAAPTPVSVRLPDICPYCGAPPRSLPNRSDNPNACPYCGADLSGAVTRR